MRKVFCFLGIHKWEITKWVTFKDKKCRHINKEGFDRKCKCCKKEQELKRPEEYHPTRYVWTDLH